MERQQDQLSVEGVERSMQSRRQFPNARAEVAYLAPQNRASHQRDLIARLEHGHHGLELLSDDGSPMGIAQQLDESVARNMELQNRIVWQQPHCIVERPQLFREPGYLAELLDAPQTHHAAAALDRGETASSLEIAAHFPTDGEHE